MVELVRWLG